MNIKFIVYQIMGLLALMLFSFLKLEAQCNHVGYLFEDEECGIVMIQELDGDEELFVVENASIPSGTFIAFDFETIGTSVCDSNSYPTIHLTCLEEIDEDPMLCIDEDMIDVNANCEDIYAPVCGCNDISYDNECRAFAAGVMSFTPGTCENQSADCSSSFVYTVEGLTGSFINTSESMEYSAWYFCIADSLVLGHTATYEFPTDGHYFVVLVSGDLNCLSADFQMIKVGNPTGSTSGCFALEDYVFPGDADYDGVANMNDMLYLGLGYDGSGFSRPSASEEWYGQMALNWEEWQGVVNYKHLDCDGNGEIGQEDVTTLVQNSTPLPAITLSEDSDLPQVSLKFDQDTIVVQDNTLGEFLVSAEVMIGSGQQPVYDFYGLSLGLTYASDLVLKPISIDYHDNCFLGSSNGLLWDYKDFKAEGQVDMSFVKNDLNTKDGYGAVAKLDIIIVEDIITLRTGKHIPFELKIKSVKMIDDKGNIKEVAVKETATLIFVNNTTVANKNPLQNKLKIYPSLVQDQLSIEVVDVKPKSVAIYDVLGRQVYHSSLFDLRHEIDTKPWTSGHYILKVQTEQGLIVKSFFKG